MYYLQSSRRESNLGSCICALTHDANGSKSRSNLLSSESTCNHDKLKPSRISGKQKCKQHCYNLCKLTMSSDSAAARRRSNGNSRRAIAAFSWPEDSKAHMQVHAAQIAFQRAFVFRFNLKHYLSSKLKFCCFVASGCNLSQYLLRVSDRIRLASRTVLL